MKRIIYGYIKYIVLILGIVGVIFGVYRGEMSTVLHKAVAICMECIGIG